MTENGNLYAVLVCDEYGYSDEVFWFEKRNKLDSNEALRIARLYKSRLAYRRAKIKRMEVKE